MATQIISRWGSTADRKLFLFHDGRQEIDLYLQAVDEIQRMLDSADSDERKNAESVRRIAMSRLADEFRNILKVNGKSSSSMNPNLNTESTTMTDSASTNYQVYEDDYVNRNTMSREAINDLRSIAVRMNSSGYLPECVKAYVNGRRSVIDAGFRRLNIEKLSRNNARRLEWGVLESKIKIWIKAAKICFKCYFEDEKRLCEEIFGDIGKNTADACFLDTVRDHTIQLLDTAEALGCIRPASERLFKILDVHDTLSGLLPWINKLFDAQSSESLRTNQIVSKLVDKANEILVMFENSVVNEQAYVLPAEPVHRLPKYAMNYVYKLCDYKESLISLSLSNPPSMAESLGLEGQSQFSVHVNWIVTSLVSNLEVKARLCEDPSARHFFAMNNFHYVIEKIKGRTEVRERVGDEVFKKVIERFEEAKAEFLKLSFERVLKWLREEKSWIWRLRMRMRKRVERLNGEIEKVEREVGKLVVGDFGLVLELRKAIVEMVVGAYGCFLVSVPGVEMYVKYTAEELETVIHGFFICKCKSNRETSTKELGEKTRHLDEEGEKRRLGDRMR